MSRFRRRLGTALIVVGVLALGYGATVYFWKDPFTSAYTAWKQHQLAGQLEESFAEYRVANDLSAEPVEPAAQTSAPTPSTISTEPAPELNVEPAVEPATSDREARAAVLAAETRQSAERYFGKLKPGQPLGRLDIPKLGLDQIVINGTTTGDLRKGPGRYPETVLPGLGQLTAIAGHRTTYGAPFRHIDDLKKGDRIALELPYGTFTYAVTGHEIVDDEDWSVIEPRGYDTLVLSACHPLYSAKQRWIVYARLMKVERPDGESYREPASSEVALEGASGT